MNERPRPPYTQGRRGGSQPATGRPPERTEDDFGIRIETLTRYVRGTLRGFVSVEVPRWHLQFYDCPFHNSSGKLWVSFAAKPQLGRDQLPVRDDRGKIVYAPVVGFVGTMGTKARDRFSAAIVKAILAIDAHAFDSPEAAAGDMTGGGQ